MQLTGLEDIERAYTSVYISPHFDDAAAACGGRIADQVKNGGHVLVVTVFSGSAGKAASRASRRFAAEYPQRRLEDKAAMTALGADYLWLDYPDIVFRTGHPLFRYRPSYRPAPADKTLQSFLVSDLRRICKTTGCSQLMLPMGIGQHMDHQILFQAGTKLLNPGEKIPGLIFYEDCPYMLFPSMLAYRMKITGLNHHLACAGSRRMHLWYNSGKKDAVELLSGRPKSETGSLPLKLISLLCVSGFGLVTRHLMKMHPPMLQKGLLFCQDLYDITPQIHDKLDAVQHYGSQLTRPVLQRRRIKNALAAYSAFLGAPSNHFYERYWKVCSQDIV